MSNSDDDLPPPLEDMSETLFVKKNLTKQAEGLINKTEDHVDEVRLAPKKKAEETKITKIEAKDENFNFENIINPPNNTKIEEKKSQKNQGFGGFSAGFLNSKPSKPKP